MTPKVSIIILNWNGWEDTIECLESLYQITYPNYNVIVVDNGSEDDSIVKIKEYCEGKIKIESKFFKYDPDNKPIKIIEYTREKAEAGGGKEEEIIDLSSNEKLIIIKNEKNYGFTGGNNIGIKYILREKKTDYILLLNNDTVVDGNFLTELVKVAESDPKIGIVGPKILNYYDGAIDFCGGKINWWLGRPYHIKHEYCGKTDFITGCCMLIKKQLIEKGIVFDNVYFSYFEDADLCEQVKRNGYSLAITNKVVVNHKISKSFRKQGEKSDSYIYLFARNRLLFNKRYNKNVLKYGIFLFLQYILKTIGAYFVFNENQFRSWLKGLGIIKEGESEAKTMHSTMKIGFFYEPHLSPGIRRYQENIFDHLKKIDDSIILIYDQENDFTAGFKNDDKYKLRYLSFLKSSKLKRLFQKIILLPIELKRKFDIIIYAYQFSPVINPFNIKKVTIVYDLIPYKYRTRFTHFLLYFILVRLSLKTSDLIISVSDETKNDLMNIFKIPSSEIKVIHSGVSEKFKFLEKEMKDYYICFFRKEPWKNYETVINLFNKYKFPYRLIVIGKRFNAKKNIEFIGDVTDNQLVELYNSAIGLLYFSAYEGFGLPILEAMACGCPVVTSTSDIMPKITTEKALKIDIENDESIIDTLNNLFVNKKFRQKIIRSGLQYSKRFSWGKCANEIYQLLR